jgi:hypothetical protein
MADAGKEDAQRRLQELLSAARGALEDALAHAKEHDLWFEFTGIRRAPRDDKRLNVNDPEEVARTLKEYEEWGEKFSKATTTVLDISEEWVGSWC